MSNCHLAERLQLEVEEVKTKVDEVKTNMDEMKTNMDEMKTKVGRIEEKLDQLLGRSQTFDDLIPCDSPTVPNDNSNADDDTTGTKRKPPPPSKPGPSKKLKGLEPKSIFADDREEVGGQTKPGGRPARLRQNIVPPSRLLESMASHSSDEADEDYEDDISPSPSRGRRRSRGAKRGSPRKTSSARGRQRTRSATPTRAVPINVNPPEGFGYLDVGVTPDLGGQRGEHACFIEYCDHNPNATLFKMPQMTKAKRKDWMKYIPAAALSKTPFDPTVHLLCEDHFDKKFILNTPEGKILTGGAIPSIFANYPKQAVTMEVMPGSGPAPPTEGKNPLGCNNPVEVVDGDEIEYDSDPDNSPTVTIHDDDDHAAVVKPRPTGKILQTDAGYTLQYIYDTREKIQLPQAEFWMFRMIVDKELKTRCIFIAEIVSRLERLMVRRSIKIRQDLTFKVEANGSDFTQMFNERGNTR